MHIGRNQSRVDKGRAIHAIGSASTGRTAQQIHPRNTRQRRLDHRVRHGTTHQSLIGIFQSDRQACSGGGIGRRIIDVGAVEAYGARRHIIGTDRACGPERGLGKFRFGLDVQTGDRHDHVLAVAAEFVHGHLQRARRRFATHSTDTNPIRCHLGELRCVEAGGDVWSGVAATGDLVEELAGHRADRDQTAGAVVFADDARTVGSHLGPWEANPVGSGHLGEERVVTTGDLSRTLDQVTCSDCSGESVPVVASPAMMVCGRPAHHSGVGDAPTDHDVGTRAQRIHDAPTPEVGIRGDVVREVPEVGIGCERHKLSGSREIGHPVEQIITIHPGNMGMQTQPVGNFFNGGRTPCRIEPARVGDHGNAPVETCPHHLLHLGDEGLGVPAARVPRTNPRQDQHRQLRQPVPGEDIDRTTLDHFARTRQPVTEES